ncbi:unnamed protein product [Allacma fusca]|uniref:Uncharacterized protein n=1 Tax=Allacma fusca TaxID=39272 RepID=A0A8J2KEN4_9HEXA|nr:unnamed protein product [Allacma fusca]
MNNTEQRHQDMKSNWLFTCTCRRCEDEGELGTFMSSGTIGSKITTISDGCLENGTDSIYHIKSSLPNDFSDVDSLETWLQKFDTDKYLHPNHSIFSQVKLFLSLYYGRQLGGIKALTNERLLRKYQFCCEIMEIFKIIYPGVYQCKGELLFELWTTVRELNTRGIQYSLQQDHTETVLVSRAYEILRHSIVLSPFHHMKEILEDEYPELRTFKGNSSHSPSSS